MSHRSPRRSLTSMRTTLCIGVTLSEIRFICYWRYLSDLKPDNILLDERGNAHLTDFNIAVHFGERRLTGVAGSMAYMAPECVVSLTPWSGLLRWGCRILNKRGYTYHIDWWSLGVCAYELIFGRRPFRGRTNSDLTYSITKDPLKWPEDAEKKCSRAGMQVLKGVRKPNTI